ncbi:MAG: 4-vinyl reductase [Candidatus Diapherotrites archaeon]
MAVGQLNFDKGKIELLKQPVAILPVDFIVEVQKQLEKEGRENLIYYSMRDATISWFNSLYDYFKISREDVVKWGLDIVTAAGWGITKIDKIDSKEKIVIFTLEDSTFANRYGKSRLAIDHFARACTAGGGALILNADVEAIETKCIAKGDKLCEFIVKEKDAWDKNDPLVKQQLKR